MPQGCTCPRDGSFYCPCCQGLLGRTGHKGGTRRLAEASRMPQELRSSSGTPVDAGGESEQRLLERVRALARHHGWLCYHTHRSDKSEAGFPDLCMTDGSRIIFVELKSATGKLTIEQANWLALLEHTGKVDTRIWRPADWPVIYAYFTQGTPTTQHDNADTGACAQQGFPRVVRRFFHEDA